jgi:hypothetical protein
MIVCPLCTSRINTDNETRQTGDCQCSREKMARHIIAQAGKVPNELKATIRRIRKKLDEAVAIRAKEEVEEQSIEILAQCAPGEPPIYEEWLCDMETLIGILDAVAPVELAQEDGPKFYLLSLSKSSPADNMLTWWRKNSAGYCWDLSLAQLYTEAEARETERASGGTERAIPQALAESLISRSVEECHLQKLGITWAEWQRARK